tara:strand:+ start:334 stop:474 length:141 start_codon:yes stop_codon:yes gene_type:complete
MPQEPQEPQKPQKPQEPKGPSMGLKPCKQDIAKPAGQIDQQHSTFE